MSSVVVALLEPLFSQTRLKLYHFSGAIVRYDILLSQDIGNSCSLHLIYQQIISKDAEEKQYKNPEPDFYLQWTVFHESYEVNEVNTPFLL